MIEYGSADATTAPSCVASLKSRMVFTVLVLAYQVVLKSRLLNCCLFI